MLLLLPRNRFAAAAVQPTAAEPMQQSWLRRRRGLPREWSAKGTAAASTGRAEREVKAEENGGSKEGGTVAPQQRRRRTRTRTNTAASARQKWSPPTANGRTLREISPSVRR